MEAEHAYEEEPATIVVEHAPEGKPEPTNTDAALEEPLDDTLKEDEPKPVQRSKTLPDRQPDTPSQPHITPWQPTPETAMPAPANETFDKLDPGMDFEKDRSAQTANLFLCFYVLFSSRPFRSRTLRKQTHDNRAYITMWSKAPGVRLKRSHSFYPISPGPLPPALPRSPLPPPSSSLHLLLS